MLSSLLRLPAALADRQKDEFLMDEKFLSRRMHESDVTNQRANSQLQGEEVEEAEVEEAWRTRTTHRSHSQSEGVFKIFFES